MTRHSITAISKSGSGRFAPKLLTLGSLLLSSCLAGAATVLAPEPPIDSWHAKSLVNALGNMAVFGLVGVVLAVVGYKIFDIATPGNLHKEIVENRNIAAAIVGAAVIIGVCIIVAAAMS